MVEFLIEYGVWGLFIAAFLSATILPFASELVLVGVIALGVDPWWALFAASTGNTIGGMTCYWLGYLFDIRKVSVWMKVKPEKLDRVYPYVHRWGYWLGFFGFAPAVGDIVMIALGSLRCSIFGVLLTSALGKTLRYYIIVFTQLKIAGM